jgi:hypothetical protein
MVKTADDVVISATNFVSERLCPIFQVWYSTLMRPRTMLWIHSYRGVHLGVKTPFLGGGVSANVIFGKK